VEATFESSDFDQHFQSLRERLAERGEIVSTSPTIDEKQPDRVNFRILYTRAAASDEVRQEVAPNVLVTELFNSINARLPSPSASVESIVNQAPLKTIPISLDDLDRLISRTHKLFRDTTKFLNRDGEVESAAGSQAASLYAGFVELAAELVNLRMVPIERVLNRAVRSGRTAARAAGKEVDFAVRGQDILLDKSLCDAIADPLTHLVRNAVDHGIENPEQRVRRGKSRKGKIHIEASALQGQTRITITDDGGGIDPELVSTAARSQKIIDYESVLSFTQSLRLIFRPGFSTATDASAISGRGVGLDVVETAVEEAGGDVRVSSMPAVGSSFEIRLPVTFALLEVWVVTVGDQRYLIDSTHVRERLTVRAEAVKATRTKETIKVGNESLLVVRLANLLEQRSSVTKPSQLDVLVGQFIKDHSDDYDCFTRVAVVADSVAGTEKVLLRNLGSRGGRWFGVTGAAELRDGKVALMLDLPRLVSRAES
jgi:two-component system chemotaxis sensor kinase CheA